MRAWGWSSVPAGRAVMRAPPLRAASTSASTSACTCSGSRAASMRRQRAGSAAASSLVGVQHPLLQRQALVLEAVGLARARGGRGRVEIQQEREVGRQAAGGQARSPPPPPRCPGRAHRPGRQATSPGSGRTPRSAPASSAGWITCATSSARAAANSSASPSAPSSTAGSLSSSRTRSPTSVPPGSRTPRASSPRASHSSRAWVVLPERSMPSKVTNRPRTPRP